MTAKPSQSNWLANNALTIVLAIVAVQNVWNTFNNGISNQISGLNEKVAQLYDFRRERNHQIELLEGRISALEARR